MSSAGSDNATQETVGVMCKAFSEFLLEFTHRTDGYMIFAAFVVAFKEMQNVINAAPEQDKEFLRQLVLATIGSFGSTVQ